MTGYTATDMSTAAANGFRDGSVAAAPGIDLEPVRRLIEFVRTLEVKDSSKNDNAGFVDQRDIGVMRGIANEAERTIDASQKGKARSRYFCSGPEGEFFCDDLKLSRELVNAYDENEDWTITDLWNSTGK